MYDGGMPALHRRMLNFTIAAIKHICNGCPTSPQHVIDARIEICEACPMMNKKRMVCIHEKCGCNLNTSRWLHKVGWLDQKCPIGKW